jgi:hypothetical protein
MLRCRMKTTRELLDELVRAINVRGVHGNRNLKERVTGLLHRGLADEAVKAPGQRVQLPLIRCAHAATAGTEMTPERVSEVLANDEADSASLR